MTPQDIFLQTTVLDIVADHPCTEPVFRSYDQTTGECVLCNALFETIESLAKKHKIDPQELLTRLHQTITIHSTTARTS